MRRCIVKINPDTVRDTNNIKHIMFTPKNCIALVINAYDYLISEDDLIKQGISIHNRNALHIQGGIRYALYFSNELTIIGEL